jgi:CHAT domain-containing protein
VRYALRVLERRGAQPEDERRLAAERAYLAGERQRNRGTAGALAEARVQLTRARELYAALGDGAGEGNALTSLGRVAEGLGERPAAVAAYTGALALHRAQGRDVAVSRWRSPYYWAGFVLQGEWAR